MTSMLHCIDLLLRNICSTLLQKILNMLKWFKTIIRKKKIDVKIDKTTLNIAFCYGVSVTSSVFIDISVVRLFIIY